MLSITQLLVLLTIVSASISSQVRETSGRPARSTRTAVRYDEEGVPRRTALNIPQVKREISNCMNANKEKRQKQMGNGGIQKMRCSSTTSNTGANKILEENVIARQDMNGRITPVHRRSVKMTPFTPRGLCPVSQPTQSASIIETTQPAEPVNPSLPDPAQPVQPPHPRTDIVSASNEIKQDQLKNSDNGEKQSSVKNQTILYPRVISHSNVLARELVHGRVRLYPAIPMDQVADLPEALQSNEVKFTSEYPVEPVQPAHLATQSARRLYAGSLQLSMNNIYMLNDIFHATESSPVVQFIWTPSLYDISLIVNPETGEY